MTGTFACTLKFLVKDCDPQTGEPDDEGYDDEYVVSSIVLDNDKSGILFSSNGRPDLQSCQIILPSISNDEIKIN